ncbi:signal peptide peptidase SppA [Methanothermobacter marburgensis]|uniref:Predicted protease n=1 Tax=Methanothermobacter marburgensis (strain ATCC BAA-927 / DSM 2133 / JCM 14651 / NBRC 100331 / OCM 82 / Marburg) TaxID=79929 RepID=D9PX44_METTM|nr:signal peptide peptidase SppA [Methanothermobacter marburgensis]ADL58792.1 predicted protease [Methanothermobacter marburgensis str. Marburg]WBF09352.1 signal peptide peptidase SppA [Methanothermobacter marburgensis]
MDRNGKIIAGLIVVLSISGLVMSISGFIGEAEGTVAIIPVHGAIAYDSAGFSDAVSPDDIKNLIEEANSDPSVKAIVLDINSPGGTPVASEELMDAIKKSEKPVVSWISDSGTSGAYLAASASDRIVASPSAWVGSIGVILDLTDLSEMYRQMGINKYAIKAGEYKDMGADYRMITDEERQMLQSMVNEEYDYFIRTVAANRNLSVSYVRGLAEGRIFTGRQALKNRLVDYTGGRDYAVDVAAKLAGLKNYDTVTLEPPGGFVKILSSMFSKLGSAGSANTTEHLKI